VIVVDSNVRQAAAGDAAGELTLYQSGTVEMTIGDSGEGGDFEGSNLPRGVPLYYSLGEEAEGPLTIEILDGAGSVIRTYSSEESVYDRCLIANMDPRRPFELEYPATEPGLNKWMWDLRRDGVHCIEVSRFSPASRAHGYPPASTVRASWPMAPVPRPHSRWYPTRA
jgi:hypothetical protein